MDDAVKDKHVVCPTGIKYYTVKDTLIPLKRHNKRFHQLFGMRQFQDNYARDDGPSGNPFEDDLEFAPDDYEWKQLLLTPDQGEPVPLLCCPEDIRRLQCAHDTRHLCGTCEIPLCHKCFPQKWHFHSHGKDLGRG